MLTCSKCGAKHTRKHRWCEPCMAEYNRAYYAANRDSERARTAAYINEHRERYQENDRKRYWEDPATLNKKLAREVLKQSAPKYQWQRAAKNRREAERRATKNKATPFWLSAIHAAQVQEFFDVAMALTTQTGVRYEVDHIHPLQGKRARGLHVPWNLQVLPKTMNASKGNREVYYS